MSVFDEVFQGTLDLLAPERCPGCDDRRDWGERGFCAACAPLLERRPNGPGVYEYGGPLAEAVRGLKFRGRVDYARALGKLWLADAAAHIGRADVVVPVPLHAARLRARGFNQTVLLVEALARTLGVPIDSARLLRRRDTPAQASLARAERDTNVRGAFRAERDAERPRVLLVDDVRTTGATLRAAAGALYRAGATTVRVSALAAVEG